MNILITAVQWLLFTYLAVQVAYLLFFSLAGRLAVKQQFKTARYLRRIRIFIPAYREDAVIIDTVRAAINHDYPASLYEVIVIADSFTEDTLMKLRQMDATVLEVSFEKSTKGKALHAAIEATKRSPADVVLVLDADNHMSPGFLHKLNDAFDQGYDVVQGHRTAKNTQTPFAMLDACTEEINNHIFRRGHNAAGLPSALIGSGMAFDWGLFVKLLHNIGDTAGEDKEVEFRIARMGKKILFLDGAFVYDEKVARKEVFSQQRSRWLAMQAEYFVKYFAEGWVQLAKGNVAFFNKVFQTYLLPRVLLVAVLGVAWVLCFFFVAQWLKPISELVAMLAVALFLAIPGRWYNRHLLSAFMQIPGAFIGMFAALAQMSKAKKQFIHTPHGEAA